MSLLADGELSSVSLLWGICGESVCDQIDYQIIVAIAPKSKNMYWYWPMYDPQSSNS